MITFPPEFVETSYPGYYWNTITKTLFSIKITGILHELKKAKPSQFNQNFKGYYVSVKGRARRLHIDYLMSLKSEPTVTSIVPIEGYGYQLKMFKD